MPEQDDLPKASQAPGKTKRVVTEVVRELPSDGEVDGGDKVACIAAILPSTVKDSHIVWGYGGYKLTVRDLRAIAKEYDLNANKAS